MAEPSSPSPLAARLGRVLRLHGGEARSVVAVAALFAALEAAAWIGDNTADALFLSRVGIEYLPLAYVAVGIVVLLVAIAYAYGLTRARHASYFSAILVALAAALLVERAAIAAGGVLVYAAIWFTVSPFLFGVIPWSVAGIVFDARQAKRIFPILGAATIVGAFAGNVSTGILAAVLGTENVLLVVSLLLLLGAFLVGAVARTTGTTEVRGEGSGHPVRDVLAGYEVVRRSSLLRVIAVASLVLSATYFLVSMPYLGAISAAYPSEAELAGILGLVSAATTVLALGVSLALANRLYARIGIAASAFLLPIVYVGGFGLWLASFTLATAVVFRVAQQVVLRSVFNPAWNAFFNVLPASRRSQALGFNEGIAVQLGVSLGGILLLVTEAGATEQPVFAVGLVAGLLALVLVAATRSRYRQALVDGLRAGLPSMFGGPGDGTDPLAGDPTARAALIAGLTDERAGVRATCVGLLARAASEEVAAPLARATADPDAEVRAAAVRALGGLLGAGVGSTGPLLDRLADLDPGVRRAAVDALAATADDHRRSWVVSSAARPAGDAIPAGGVPARIGALRTDPDPAVRAAVARALDRLGDHASADAIAVELLASPDIGSRVEGLELVAALPAGRPPSTAEGRFRDALVAGLDDRSASVRLAAVDAAARSVPMARQALLLPRLGDPAPSVRERAASAIRPLADARVVAGRLRDAGSEEERRALLEALGDCGPDVRPTLLGWAEEEADRAAELQGAVRALTADPRTERTPAIAYLRDLATEAVATAADHVLGVLGALGHRDVASLIAHGLRSDDRRLRAQSLEALDAVGDDRVSRSLVQLLDHAPGAHGVDAAAAMRRLSEDRDPWLRALARYVLDDVEGLPGAEEPTGTGAEEPTATGPEDVTGIREAAMADARAGHGGVEVATRSEAGTMTRTLPTLTTVERILFLRRVPIFASLAPDDLRRIGDVAREELFDPQAVLIEEGDKGDDMFVIVDGLVRITRRTPEGEVSLRVLGPGDQLGELAILLGRPRTATATAEGGPVRALAVGGADVKAILRERPDAALAMLTSLAERLSA